MSKTTFYVKCAPIYACISASKKMKPRRLATANRSRASPSSRSSSSSGGTLEEHSRFHDASPGRTIRCSPQCRVKSKVERFEIALDCSKPGLTILGGANQQGGDRWMLVAHVSGPLRLQPVLYVGGHKNLWPPTPRICGRGENCRNLLLTKCIPHAKFGCTVSNRV